MSPKKWIIIYITISISVIISIGTFVYLNKVPLRFTNSISYDAKLNFLHDKQCLKDADTLVVGSSMALNNISGITLEEKSSKIKKVVNLSSWGIGTPEVYRLLKNIDLSNIKYIIYSTEYEDITVGKTIVGDMDAIRQYMHNKFSFIPYLKLLSSAYKNLYEYYNYRSIYLNPNGYKSLFFDRTGSVNFTFPRKRYKKSRWNNISEFTKEITESGYENLKNIIYLAKDNNITLIMTTSPMRQEVLDKNPEVMKKVSEYIEILKDQSERKGFIYVDVHNILQLEDKYFVGATHLNKLGAIAYTNAILEEAHLK